MTFQILTCSNITTKRRTVCLSVRDNVGIPSPESAERPTPQSRNVLTKDDMASTRAHGAETHFTQMSRVTVAYSNFVRVAMHAKDARFAKFFEAWEFRKAVA